MAPLRDPNLNEIPSSQKLDPLYLSFFERTTNYFEGEGSLNYFSLTEA